jgi:hypothetical protein
MTDFSDVKAGLQAEDVFTDPAHNWKTQTERRWKGGCPWHDSSSGTCFSVNPGTLEWHCFQCKRGGGPLEYVAELENIGTGSTLDGKDFIRAWDALSEHARCDGPPDPTYGGERNRNQRRPLQRRTKQPAKTRAKADAFDPAPAPDTSPSGADGYTERELRRALVRYREALKSSEPARTYVRARGLSVDTLYEYGCGYAAPGEWLEDDTPRIVTPHTTPDGRLVNLYGREVASDAPQWRKHRHLPGRKALFNGPAISDGSGPLVICESSLDALSIIEAGHPRAVAVHGKTGLPWDALRGNVETIVFALDGDATADAEGAAREAVLRGYEAFVFESYGDANDPNEALQAGTLDVAPIRELGGDFENNPMQQGGNAETNPMHEAGGGPETAADGDASGASPDDLPAYWNGRAIGHLGRWIWTRRRVPIGRVDDTLHADRELHAWIADELQRGPEKARDPERLETVLWKLYVAFSEHGPGAPPTAGTPVQAPFDRHGSEGAVRESYFDPRRRTYRVAVQPRDGMPMDTRYFDRSELETSQT